MNDYSVEKTSALKWGSAVFEVVGIIDLVHPPMTGTGWGLQNGVLRDPKTGAKIEFMLSKHKKYWEKNVIGRTVRLVAARGEEMIWKEQQPKRNVNGGKPFAKLEIPGSVTIQWDEETPSLFSHTAPGHGDRPEESSPARSVEQKAPQSAAAAGTTRGTDDVKAELRRMLALHALTKAEVSTSPFVKDHGQNDDEIVWRLFAAGCLNGLHNKLDPNQVLTDLDPSAVVHLRPKYHELMGHFQGREKMLKIMLIGSGLMDADQDISSLTEDRAAAALTSPALKEMLQPMAAAS